MMTSILILALGMNKWYWWQGFESSSFQCGYGSRSCSSSKWCESATTGLQTLQASVLSLQATIFSVHGPPRLHFEPCSAFYLEVEDLEFCLWCGCGSVSNFGFSFLKRIWIRIRGPYTERIDLWFEPLKEIRRVIEWLQEIKTADQHCYKCLLIQQNKFFRFNVNLLLIL